MTWRILSNPIQLDSLWIFSLQLKILYTPYSTFYRPNKLPYPDIKLPVWEPQERSLKKKEKKKSSWNNLETLQLLSSLLSDLNYASINPSSNGRLENGTFLLISKDKLKKQDHRNHYSWIGSSIHLEGNHSKFLIIFTHHIQRFLEKKTPIWFLSRKLSYSFM